MYPYTATTNAKGFTFTYPSVAGTRRLRLCFKRVFCRLGCWMIAMFKGNCGKLMVYASTGFPSEKRLESVRTAAKETAKRLNLDFEIVRFERASLPIYVYYEENDGEEPVSYTHLRAHE